MSGVHTLPSLLSTFAPVRQNIITSHESLQSTYNLNLWPPAHGALAVLGLTEKYLVEIPSYIVAYRNHHTANERCTSTPAESIKLHGYHHIEEYTGHEFYKTIIGNGYRKFMPEPSTDTVLVLLLEITKYTEVTVHEYRHDFTFRKPSLTIPAIFSIAAIGW